MDKTSFLENIYFSCEWIIGLLFFIPSILMFINIKTSSDGHASSIKIKLLQGLILSALICALSVPVLHPSPITISNHKQPFFLMVENDLSSKDNWDKTTKYARSIINKFIDSGTNLYISSSAPDNGKIIYAKHINPALAKYMHLAQIKPQKLPDFTQVEKHVLDSKFEDINSLWISQSINYSGLSDAMSVMQRYGSVFMLQSDNRTHLYVKEATAENNKISIYLSTIGEILKHDTKLHILLLDSDKRPLASKATTFKKGYKNKHFYMDLPAKIIRKTSFIKIKESTNIASIYKTTQDWYKPLILVLGKGMHASTSGKKVSYKHGGFFISSALDGLAEVSFDIEDIKNDPAVIFIADNIPLTPSIENALMLWVDQGGELIYFADDNPILEAYSLFDKSEFFKPPQKIIPDENIIFDAKNILISEIVTPSKPELYKEQNWQPIVSLKDGKPVISQKYLGNGNLIYIHSSSAPIGNNMALNISFVNTISKLAKIAPQSNNNDNLTNQLYGLNAVTEPPSGIYNLTLDELEKEISLAPYFLLLSLILCVAEHCLSLKTAYKLSNLRLIPYSIIIIQALRLWSFSFSIKIIAMPLFLSYIWYKELHPQPKTTKE